jgi:hypothetical protein
VTEKRDPFREYLEGCRRQATQLAAGAEFALGGEIQYIYGLASGKDLASEEGLIAYALRFANGQEDPALRDMALSLPPPGQPQPDPQFHTTMQDKYGPEQIEAQRARLRSTLTTLCRKEQPAELSGSEHMLRDVWPLPVLQRTPHLHLAVCWVFLNVEAFNALLGVLLLDKQRGFGRRLRRCELKECPHFFLQPVQKGNPKKYCSELCMEAAHKATNDTRAEQSRRRARARNLLRAKLGRRGAADVQKVKDAVTLAFKNHPAATAEQLADYAHTPIRAARKHK